MKSNFITYLLAGCGVLMAFSACSHSGATPYSAGKKSEAYAKIVNEYNEQREKWNKVLTQAVRAEFCRPYAAPEDDGGSCAYYNIPPAKSEHVRGAEFKQLMHLLVQMQYEPVLSYEDYDPSVLYIDPPRPEDALRFYDASGRLIAEYGWVNDLDERRRSDGTYYFYPNLVMPSAVYAQYTNLPSFKRYKKRIAALPPTQ